MLVTFLDDDVSEGGVEGQGAPPRGGASMTFSLSAPAFAPVPPPAPSPRPPQEAEGLYKRKVQTMMDRSERRLIVDLGDLRRALPGVADKCVCRRPPRLLPPPAPLLRSLLMHARVLLATA